jgi:protein phosphatase
MRLSAASYSDCGPVRPLNADALLADAARGFFAVADGVGSEPESAAASRFAVERAHAAYQDLLADRNTISPHELLAQVKREYADAFGDLDPPATTLTVGHLAAGRFHYFNVGDSPVLLLAGSVRLLTREHTIVDRGMVITDFSRMKSVRGSNVIFNYLGSDEAFAPDYEPVEVAARARFLLCTDGVFDFLAQEELDELHTMAETPAQFVAFVRSMAAAALPSDNYSLIVVDAEP